LIEPETILMNPVILVKIKKLYVVSFVMPYPFLMRDRRPVYTEQHHCAYDLLQDILNTFI